MVFFELLPRNQTINSDVYCRHLNKLNAAVNKKRSELVNRKGVILHHDNAYIFSHSPSAQNRGKLFSTHKNRDKKFFSSFTKTKILF